MFHVGVRVFRSITCLIQQLACQARCGTIYAPLSPSLFPKSDFVSQYFPISDPPGLQISCACYYRSCLPRDRTTSGFAGQSSRRAHAYILPFRVGMIGRAEPRTGRGPGRTGTGPPTQTRNKMQTMFYNCCLTVYVQLQIHKCFTTNYNMELQLKTT